MSRVSPQECKLDWCDLPRKCKGLCDFHYKRQWAGVPLDRPILYKGARREGKTCSHGECNRPIKTWDLCSFHGHRKRNGLDMDSKSKANTRAGMPKYVAPKEWREAVLGFDTCVISGCQGKRKNFYLMCNQHNSRAKRFCLSAVQLQSILDIKDCRICLLPLGTQESTRHIDHDHSCCPRSVRKCCGNCIRGIVCNGCNLGLGAFRDNTEAMARAIEYLKT